MIVEVTTTNPINAEQLSEELGTLATVADGVVTATDIPQAELQAAVDDHVPDPDYHLPMGVITALNDATKDKATWDALTNPQRLEATRQAIQLLLQTIRFIHRRLL